MFSTLLYAAVTAAIFCFSFASAVPFRASTVTSRQGTHEEGNLVAANVLPLRRFPGPSQSRQGVAGRHGMNMKRGNSSYILGNTVINWQNQGQNLVTTIVIDGQEFIVLVDTGSSDTWIASSSLDCISLTDLKAESQSDCKFGSLYHATSSTRTLPDSLNVTYGGGQFVTGTMIQSSISVAELNIPNQEIGLVRQAAWQGDALTSGIMGLAFPAVTNAFAGSDPKAASGATQVPYSPISLSLVSGGVTNSYFSIVLDRPTGKGNGDAAGYLAFGGVPNVKTVGDWVTAPLLKSTTSFFNGSSIAPEYQFYTIKIDAIAYQQPLPDKNDPETIIAEISKSSSSSSDTTSFPALIGSASSFLYLPIPVADAINSLFEPPVIKSNGIYSIPCNSTSPTMGVSISGELFWIDPVDLVLKQPDGSCVSAVADGGDAAAVGALFELGHPFLKNVVAVFDVGGAEMRFVRRN